jgi:hypothetical protein
LTWNLKRRLKQIQEKAKLVLFWGKPSKKWMKLHLIPIKTHRGVAPSSFVIQKHPWKLKTQTRLIKKQRVSISKSDDKTYLYFIICR